jgi:hypothetical protein
MTMYDHPHIRINTHFILTSKNSDDGIVYRHSRDRHFEQCPPSQAKQTTAFRVHGPSFVPPEEGERSRLQKRLGFLKYDGKCRKFQSRIW